MAGKKNFLVAADGSVESQSVVKYTAAMLSPVDTEVFFSCFKIVPIHYAIFPERTQRQAVKTLQQIIPVPGQKYEINIEVISKPKADYLTDD